MDFDSIHRADKEVQCLDFILATKAARKPRRTVCVHCGKKIEPGMLPAHLRTHGKSKNKAPRDEWTDFQQTRAYFKSELNKPLPF